MIEMQQVTSAAMKAWGYDPASRTLAVCFKSDRVHHFVVVPQEVADQFAAAPSKGAAVGQILGAGGYRSVPVLEGESIPETAPA